MLQCLDKFCVASREKVNLEKTKIYFSKNVFIELANQVITMSEFEKVPFLGKYLRVPILQGKISKVIYAYLVDTINQKLNSCVVRNLTW